VGRPRGIHYPAEKKLSIEETVVIALVAIAHSPSWTTLHPPWPAPLAWNAVCRYQGQPGPGSLGRTRDKHVNGKFSGLGVYPQG
jgi:hypothetical protein